jgi:uncharacterized protein YggE
MSQNGSGGNTSAIVAVCVVFCFTLTAVVVVFAVNPDGESTLTLVGALLGTIAPTIAALAVLVQVKGVQATQADQGAQIDKVASDTHALTNGLLDSKVRAGVSEVLRPDLIHPDARDTIQRDKAVREDHESESDTP